AAAPPKPSREWTRRATIRRASRLPLARDSRSEPGAISNSGCPSSKCVRVRGQTCAEYLLGLRVTAAGGEAMRSEALGLASALLDSPKELVVRCRHLLSLVRAPDLDLDRDDLL